MSEQPQASAEPLEVQLEKAYETFRTIGEAIVAKKRSIEGEKLGRPTDERVSRKKMRKLHDVEEDMSSKYIFRNKG